MAFKVVFSFTVLQFVFLMPAVKLLPLCDLPCGPNAYCVKTNQCACHPGYELRISELNGLPYCQLQSESPCREGYELNELGCIPKCSSGCANGYCEAPELCDCYEGYKSVGNACTVGLKGYKTMTTTASSGAISNTVGAGMTDVGSIEPSSTPDEPEEWTTRIAVAKDRNAAEVATHKSVEPQSDYSDSTEEADSDELCSAGYVFYEGGCRPQIVETASDLCNLKICGPNTQCVDAGKCACLPGYSWQYGDSGRSMICISSSEVNERLLVESQDSKSSWLGNVWSALGILCVVAALLFLLIVLYKHYK